MGNYGQIRPKMKFGTYDATFNQKSSEYKSEKSELKWTCEGNRYDFFDRSSGEKKVFMERGIRFDYFTKSDLEDEREPEHGRSTNLAYIKMGSYLFGAEEPSTGSYEKLNKFDYIIGNGQHAVDLDGNGVVSADEIFSGEMDYRAYLDSKFEGDIKKYKEYRSEE